LHSSLRDRPNLEVDILVDCLRTTREHPSPSSASLISSLHAAFPGRVRLSLYHTPDLSGWTKRVVPRRFDEGWGLWHGKVYGFDDDVLISG
jgi:CDP-diacylglycerol--glycerol-3-phosphate 3-phosphatidyltransferase